MFGRFEEGWDGRGEMEAQAREVVGAAWGVRVRVRRGVGRGRLFRGGLGTSTRTRTAATTRTKYRAASKSTAS
jgi:hypothetical protein